MPDSDDSIGTDPSARGRASARLLVRSGLGEPAQLANLRALHARPRARLAPHHHGGRLRCHRSRDLASHLPEIDHDQVRAAYIPSTVDA